MPLYNNIQMKTRRGLEWEYLYPKTIIDQVIGYKSFSKIENKITGQSIEAGMNSTLSLIEGNGIKLDFNQEDNSITISSNTNVQEILDNLNMILWDDDDDIIEEEPKYALLTENNLRLTNEDDVLLRIEGIGF